MIECYKCKKKVRRDNACAMLGFSTSGASCITYLCVKCAKIDVIKEEVMKLNDLKLDVMDGVFCKNDDSVVC